MSQVTLFIDGENFLHKIEEVITDEKIGSRSASSIDIRKLIASALPALAVNQVNFYAAKLHYHEETTSKSKKLIATQRKLRNLLVTQGVEFILAGNVRAQKIGSGATARVIFREKGVDVRLAVDMVALACDKKLKTAILCSSDSDLQPAVSELKRRGVEVVYLGFEARPNKGLAFTCDRTILFRNNEVIGALQVIRRGGNTT
ncbi:hypothetical protein COY17_00900 [Candidatus Saccharibacteria bacterium CG_4_10_14_0_2_um_filter_52_9]|nr:MAG: hypothetical protein COY17_00900 [Candidatus Saccharibacteria bacterium CG_4_10_14_0_2_um_filter_52_9]